MKIFYLEKGYDFIKDIKKSPIRYNGNKYKVIKKGLTDYFPKNIDTLIEPFCGSGTVSLNTLGNKYILNDNLKEVTSLLKMFQENKDITNNIENILKEYDLLYLNNISHDNRSKNFNKEIYQKHIIKYNKLREDYNKTKDIVLLFILTIFSFSHNIRFNRNNEFNMPVGNGSYNNQYIKDIKQFQEWLKNNKIHITNKDFRELNINKIKRNDFVYLDPPYLITIGTYNENNNWIEKDEIDLYNLCDKLHNNGIKFGLSNVIFHKDKENTILKDFIKKYNYIDLDITYSSMGKGNKNSKEIFVYNYDIKEMNNE